MRYTICMEQRRKKILFVVTKSVWGGAQKYVFTLASNIQEHFEPAVATGGDGPLIQKLLRAGVKTIVIPRLERDLGLLKELQTFIDLFSTYTQEDPGIIHLNSSKAGGLGAVAAWLYKKIYRKKTLVVFTAHGWPFGEERGILYKILIFASTWLTAFFSDRIITISKIDLSKSRLFWLIRKKKFLFIPNGIEKIYFLSKENARVELEKRISSPLNKDKILVGTVAELTKNKGLAYLIEALSQVRKAGVDFECVIIGDGEEKDRLVSLIRKHGLSDRIFFTGFINYAERLLKAFDIFVLPSIKEGLPYVIMEALSAGIPTIATRVGGISDLIQDHSNGILIETKNDKALGEALITQIKDNNQRKKLGEKAVQSFAHDAKTMIEKTITLAYDVK